ncbi:hypothetical protein BDL97_19G082900 [Sphagnum fallax]|nr:hypothetical protein BDL97_19G082900 [Sphagnum fallax]KAH8932615.1 hypothetical protein BDL97_19G082900 [Sphagnum fallax]
MQARRAAGLEQELETSKQKVALLTRENQNLQEELSEAYRLKSRLAEVFKAAVEKNSQVEKEVKYYQGEVAAALAARDKAIVEVERVHEGEKIMTTKMQETQARLKSIEDYSKEQETQQKELQEELETSKAQLVQLFQVVEKFWQLREKALGSSEEDELHSLQPMDKATALLSDTDSHWCCGHANQQAEDAHHQEVNDAPDVAEKQHERSKELESQLINLKEQYEASIQSFETQLTEERGAHQQATEKASTLEAHLEQFKQLTAAKLDQVYNEHQSLKLDIFGCLEEEKQWIQTMFVNLQSLKEEATTTREFHSEPVDKYEEERGPLTTEVTSATDHSVAANAPLKVENEPMVTPPEVPIEESTIVEVVPESATEAHRISDADTNEIRITQEEHFSAVVNMGRSTIDMDDDSQKVLAQALQEKVEALLLLSQQEERYHLESKMIHGLEAQIRDLNQKISQVTGEKVSALMEVAQVRQDCQRYEERERQLIRMLQQHRSTSAGSRLLPASWSEANVPAVPPEATPAVTDKHSSSQKASPLTTAGYLKSWLRALDVSGPGFKASPDSSKRIVIADSSRSSQTDECIDFAKLRVENAALRERVASVQRLTESAHRLRMALVKASNDSQNEKAAPSLQVALEVVQGVSAEAQQLKIALGCSLPISWPGQEIVPEPEQSSDLSVGEATVSSVEGAARAAIDTASAAGIEMVELLLATSELQKQALQCQLDMLAN